MKHRAEIDGLRAIAVVPVILFHAGIQALGGGFVGVDVFFVISGYLITGIIINELDGDGFSLLKFYERRARRILPALFFVILVSIPIAWLVLLPNAIKDFAQSVVAVATFSSNILFWHESGYFDTSTELKPMLHTWSLAVEEQFYIFFPLLLMATWRLGKTVALRILAVIFIVSLGAAHWGAYNWPSASFYLLPARGWELLIGSFAAFYTQKNTPVPYQAMHNLLSFAGLGAIIAAIFIFDEHTPFPSLYALLPTVGTGLIILFANKGTFVHWLLSLKGIVGIGLISYSLYLWHQPVFAFLRNQYLFDLTQAVWIAAFAFVTLAAYLTWRFIEAPFRSRTRISAKTVFISASTLAAVFVVLGLGVNFKFNDFKQLWLSGQPPKHHDLIVLIEDNDARVSNFGADADGRQRFSNCRLNVKELNAKIETRLRECLDEHGPGTLIIGDSHAIDLFGVVASRFNSPFLVGITHGGCRPHTPKDHCQYEPVRDFLESQPDVFQHVIYEQAGFYLIKEETGKKGSRRLFEGLDLNAPVQGIVVDTEHVERTFAYLADISQFVPVTWFGPRMEPFISIHHLVRNGCEYRYQFRQGVPEIFAAIDQEIDLLANQNSTVRFVSQNAVFQFKFPQDFMTCSALYWSDQDHFSANGEERFGKRLPDDFLTFKPN